MLVLGRRYGQEIIIETPEGRRIRIVVAKWSGYRTRAGKQKGTVYIGVEAEREVIVRRSEGVPHVGA